MSRRAGLLKHRITIEAAATSRSASGDTILDWDNPTTVGQRWAAMHMKTSREVYSARQFIAETDVVFETDGHIAVTEKMRVLHQDGRAFDILGVQSTDGRAPVNAKTIQLFCLEGTSKGA